MGEGPTGRAQVTSTSARSSDARREPSAQALTADPLWVIAGASAIIVGCEQRDRSQTELLYVVLR